MCGGGTHFFILDAHASPPLLAAPRFINSTSYLNLDDKSWTRIDVGVGVQRKAAIIYPSPQYRRCCSAVICYAWHSGSATHGHNHRLVLAPRLAPCL